MCTFDRGLLSKTEGDNMPSQTGHHGGGWQLYPNQGLGKIKGVKEKVLSRLRGLFQILSSICFSRKLLFLCTMAFILTYAHGEMQTGVCSIVNPERKGLSCPCSPTELGPMKWVNTCIPHGLLNVQNHCSPDSLWPLIPSWEIPSNGKVVASTVLALIGLVGLAGRMLYKRWRAFTEADISRGLMSEPAVPRRSDPTFQIPPRID